MKLKSIYAWSLLLCGAVGVLCLVNRSAADNTTAKESISPQAAEFFETQIRPLLVNKCIACHGAKQQLGGVRLDSRLETLKDSGSGPIVVPGAPEKSLLLTVVHYDGKVKMPPTGKLKPEEIAALTQWITMGAPWPAGRDDSAKTTAAKPHWAFLPIRNPAVPKVKDAALAKNPIDAFLLAKLERRSMTFAPPADRRTLIRRATFDLTGVPPTPAEIDAFVADKSPDAYEKVVDRLLASPRYGERWGRHWLDVARYADTKGYSFDKDPNFRNAYTYRDYVIRAFNEDLPYDQFILQQLAADKLPLGDDHRPLAALGFLTLGRRFLNQEELIMDDRIDVTCRGLMGLTVACARCHDHKFDPIPTKDYYSLYGVFASAHEPDVPVAISPKEIREPYEQHNRKRVAAAEERDNLIHAQVRRLREIVAKSPKDLSPEIAKTLQGFREGELPNAGQSKSLLPAFETAAQERLKTLDATIAELDKTVPTQPEFAVSLVDYEHPRDPRVFKRGNIGNQGDAVPRRFLAALSGPERKPYADGGRLQLAQDIASRNNPLTARVWVNRVWMYHFGAGLVRTPGDFGTRGEPPTHPELLDYLATRFMENGWSTKKLQRLILLSNAYRQASDLRPACIAADPENRLLWRQNPQRLDFEALRDSLLCAAGQLDEIRGGPSVPIIGDHPSHRRAVYGFIERQNLPGLFRTFDLANPDTSSAQRYRTTVPQQALFMMNSPFLLELAKSLAHRPELTAAKDDTQRIRLCYRLLFGRLPTPEETTLGLTFLKRPASASQTSAAPVWQYGYGAYDEGTQHVTKFTPFAHWTGGVWQGSAQLPDPQLAYLTLNATGGHPGNDAAHAVIRRWTAPYSVTIRIRGILEHSSDKGDGVEGVIVLGRQGEVGRWVAQHSKTITSADSVTVKKGDTLDFVVNCRTNPGYDSFLWSPTITTLSAPGVKTTAAASEEKTEWSAESDFSGPTTAAVPALSTWEKYAHVLLMTNEFCFVD